MADFRFLAPLGVLIGLLLLVPSASATHVQCGQGISEDTRLDSDLDCSDPFRDGPSVLRCRGLVISVDSGAERPITVDLGGHTITGPGVGRCKTNAQTSSSEGISVQAPHVTIRNGTIERFDDGIGAGPPADAEQFDKLTLRENGTAIYGAARVIARNTFERNFNGLQLQPLRPTTIVGNKMIDNRGRGIIVWGPEDVLLSQNRITNSGSYGIHVESNIFWVPSHFEVDDGNYVLDHNTVSHNGADGIASEVPSTTFVQNRAFFNSDLGIEAVPGATDGGGNKARGNGNPAQCVGVSCK